MPRVLRNRTINDAAPAAPPSESNDPPPEPMQIEPEVVPHPATLPDISPGVTRTWARVATAAVWAMETVRHIVLYAPTGPSDQLLAGMYERGEITADVMYKTLLRVCAAQRDGHAQDPPIEVWEDAFVALVRGNPPLNLPDQAAWDEASWDGFLLPTPHECEPLLPELPPQNSARRKDSPNTHPILGTPQTPS